MLLTRETDYALRILRALTPGECLTAADLAEKEDVPQKFAYKILKKLERADFVRIHRGANGGCFLKADLHKISLYDLIEAVETNARLTSCMTPGYPCEWREKSGGKCTIYSQLFQVQRAIDQELKSHSLYWVLYGTEEE